MMKETPWKEYKEGAQKYRIRARYGIDYDFARQNKQKPSFSITVDIERRVGSRWREEGGGAAHQEVIQHFPKLAKYVPWHLVSTKEPLHYIANGMYWYEKIGKPKERRYDPDAEDAFKKTIVFGGVSGEKFPDGVSWREVNEWLNERLPMLMDNFTADMKELGVLEE